MTTPYISRGKAGEEYTRQREQACDWMHEHREPFTAFDLAEALGCALNRAGDLCRDLASTGYLADNRRVDDRWYIYAYNPKRADTNEGAR